MSEDGKPVSGSVYFYAPNKAAPAFFAVAFAVSGFWHLWQCYRYKCFRVTALYPVCCLLFTVGFAVREYGAFDYKNLNVYIASTTFIYASPPLLELGNYHILGRVLFYVPYFSPLHPGRVLTTFGMLSSVVEALNGIGVAYTANRTLPDNLVDLGHALMKASLIIQIVVISLFCVLATTFHHKCFKNGIRTKNVWGPLLTLYISMTLIMIRTIYRTVEYFGLSNIRIGSDIDPMTLSPVVRYEWFFMVFEATLMLINSYLWNFCHPRRYLPEKYQTYLAQDGVTELEGPGWKDNRHWLVTVVDPFGFCGSERKGQKPFWETNGYAHLSANSSNLRKGASPV